MWLSKPTHLLYHPKRKPTQSTKNRNHKHPRKKYILRKTDTLNSIDKSRSTTRTNLSNKSTSIENPSEIDIHRDN